MGLVQWCLFGKLSKYLLSILGSLRVDKLQLSLSAEGCSRELWHQTEVSAKSGWTQESLFIRKHDNCWVGCKEAAKVIAVSGSSPTSEDAQVLSKRKEVFTYPHVNSVLWGPNTLIFCKFTEFHWISPASFSDTEGESHSPIPEYFCHK